MFLVNCKKDKWIGKFYRVDASENMILSWEQLMKIADLWQLGYFCLNFDKQQSINDKEVYWQETPAEHCEVNWLYEETINKF